MLQKKSVPFPDSFPHLLRMASAELVLTADNQNAAYSWRSSQVKEEEKEEGEDIETKQKYHRKHIKNIIGNGILTCRLQDSVLKTSNNN